MAIFILKLLYSLLVAGIFYLPNVPTIQEENIVQEPICIEDTEEVIIEDVIKKDIEDESVEIISEHIPERTVENTVSRSGMIDRSNLEDIINQNTELEFIKPVEGGYISSNYGYRGEELHTGVDIAIAKGTEIYASEAGIVSFAGWRGGYGNLVIVDHSNGYQTYYAHCNTLSVVEEQEVNKQDVIAYVGSTGRSTGNHVHFEIRKDGKLLNPNDYTNLI